MHLIDGVSFPTDTNSSIFVDYPSDTAFVGDDSGYLHKFNPVFNSTALNPPSEVTGGGWPVQVNPGTPTALTSPVYDSVTGNVLVADAGGFLYSVNSSTAAVTASATIGFLRRRSIAGPGIVEGPILDYTAELVYVFATSDGSGAVPAGLTAPPFTSQSTAFAAGEHQMEAVVGNSTHRTYTAKSHVHWRL